MPLGSWEGRAGEWLAWARAPGFDSYWRFHRDAFLALVPPPGCLTLEIGCGEGRLVRDLARRGHRVVGLDPARTLVAAAADHPEGAGPVVSPTDSACPSATRWLTA